MAAADSSNTFLLFGDVHFNPFADSSLVPLLAASDVSQWKAILSSSSQTAYAAYGQDSNYSLFESALDDMAARAGDVSVVIYPGDILSHNFAADYASLTGDTSQEGLNAFIRKTVTFFAQEVDSRFPDATVIIANGNADSAYGEIGSHPGDPFLSLSAPVFAQTFFNDAASQTAFAVSYSMGGYYAVSPDGPTGIKYISLNDNLWANEVGDPSAGAMELAWFASELAESAQNFQKVYVVAHIPTGAIASSVAGTYEATGQVSYTGTLANAFNDAFEGLELAYSGTIAANFVGHTHNDDFRLITSYDGSGAAELLRVTPSISPVFGNNPGYQIYTYDPMTYSLVDETTYVLDLQSSAPQWSLEYDYAATYGQDLSTPAAWYSAYAEILTNPAAQTAYLTNLSQGATNAGSLDAATTAATLLTPGFTTQTAYNAAGALLLGKA
ncbi:metallophosphoesterase [Solidesulfovibrio sp.]|uniref:metallophosphoesterase n=1 Tax=Solidesulfovibrio sp. TaxID=2910990 RepID=UPI002635B5BE|nr:metallophosphoesterase [Solidesulfovibrio sp.]